MCSYVISVQTPSNYNDTTTLDLKFEVITGVDVFVSKGNNTIRTAVL